MDFESCRVLVVDPMCEEESVYSFRNSQEPAFSPKTLVDLFQQPRFPRHISGNNQGWLKACRLMHGDHVNDNKCVYHALELCASLVNQRGDFNDRWHQASSNRQCTMMDLESQKGLGGR